METNKKSPESTEEKWRRDKDIQNWLSNRQTTDLGEQVKFWLDTVEFSRVDNLNVRGTWASLEELPNEQEVVKSIAYIERTQPKETWNWRLQPQSERYVDWWCHMRKFIDDWPDFKNSTTVVPVNTYPTYIYPTLEKWSTFLDIETDVLPVTAVQDMILVKFAEWLLKLAHDRQTFGSEKIYNTEIPRIILVNGKEPIFKILNQQSAGKVSGKIQARDASVIYIMDEGRKILSERGDNTDFWFKINEKYIWLLGT
jgi:hypothetical protein